ncbi:hypothetical protein DSO57_1034278 [Entomophthora muscae]|uniref:Uncharacterized protein n=1 Tax=Entomophthora muscae TaxID=34485 RepID=A0ACC2TZE7_9FUNG|nr:hypothetical protein DSO57_1034278 [Entomophthora muscae]
MENEIPILNSFNDAPLPVDAAEDSQAQVNPSAWPKGSCKGSPMADEYTCTQELPGSCSWPFLPLECYAPLVGAGYPILVVGTFKSMDQSFPPQSAGLPITRSSQQAAQVIPSFGTPLSPPDPSKYSPKPAYLLHMPPQKSLGPVAG